MSPARTPRRRRWLWIGLAALALAGIALLLRPAPPDAAPAPRIAEPPPLAATAAPSGAAPDALPEAIERYLASTVYPPGSGPLSPDDVSLLEPNRRYETLRPIRDTRGDPAGAVRFALSGERYDLTGTERTRVWLEVERGGRPLEIAGVEARLEREGRDGTQGDPIPVAFEPADGRWEGELPLERVADHHGALRLRARFEYAPGRSHEDAIRFFHTPSDRIPAHFDGRFHDYVRDGSLVVEVGLEVERAGFFRIDANLYDAAGEPVAFTAFKGELGSGRTMAPLSVFGKLLRDVGSAPPYTLGELRGYRFIDGSYPDHETIPETALAFTTERYALGEFSDSPWDSPEKQRMVELMLDDAEAGLSLEVPPLPDAAGAAPPAAPPVSEPAR